MNTLAKILILTISVVWLGSGCGSSSSSGEPPSDTAVFQPGTHPRFDPVTRDLPFNTDLVFAAAASTDGTADVGPATDPVRAAVNQLDGFSTSAYFDVLISGSVDPDTVVPMQTVFLLEVNTGGNDALNPANIVGLTGPASFDTRVVSLDGGTDNVIRIRPTAPLKPRTKYLVFLTNGIEDAQGEALTPSWTYNALRDTEFTVIPALQPVRGAVLGWEQLASGFLAAVSNGALTPAQAVDRLVLTYTFTTTDPQAPLIAMASPRAVIVSTQIASGAELAVAVGNANALESAGLLPTPKPRELAIAPQTGVDFSLLSQGALQEGVGSLYTGYIELPYYLTAPDPEGPFNPEFLTRHWLPDLNLAAALDVEVPQDVDGSYNVTYRYPFAEATELISVPLQLTLPADDHVPGYAGPFNCSEIYLLEGYPVVIFIHGIGADRTSGLALAHTLASQCIATVAVDLPMHGVAANNPLVVALNVEHGEMIPFAALYGDNAPRERHFNVAGSGGAPAPMNFEEPGATDGSGAQYINLGYLANTRDNSRQAVMDQLNLNASLTSVNEATEAITPVGLNLARVYVVGQSLGGILGTVYATVNELAIANDGQAGLAANLIPIRGLVATAAGTQVSQILVNSETFGPVINNGLAASGVEPGTSNYERFLYAAQSTVDSGDPVNFASTLAALDMPVLLVQINGDTVIPNSADSAPLAGTAPMAELLGAVPLPAGTHELGRGIVRMTAGGHSSLLRPEGGAPQVTSEMHVQVVSFVLGDAEVVVVGQQAPDDIEDVEEDTE